jgi:hypothetical protein
MALTTSGSTQPDKHVIPSATNGPQTTGYTTENATNEVPDLSTSAAASAADLDAQAVYDGGGSRVSRKDGVADVAASHTSGVNAFGTQAFVDGSAAASGFTTL